MVVVAVEVVDLVVYVSKMMLMSLLFMLTSECARPARRSSALSAGWSDAPLETGAAIVVVEKGKVEQGKFLDC